MAKPRRINIHRPHLDEGKFRLKVGMVITGFMFVITIVDHGTLTGAVTDGPNGYVEFDPLAGTPTGFAQALPVGSYTWFVVMTDTAGRDTTIAEGRYVVRTRGQG